MDLLIWEFHLSCGLLWSISFTYHIVFVVHPLCSMCEKFIPFLWLNNTALYGYTILGLPTHQLIDSWVTPTFWLIMNNTVMNICVQVFVWTYVFSSLGIDGSYGNSMFNFLRNFQDHSFYFLWNSKWKNYIYQAVGGRAHLLLVRHWDAALIWGSCFITEKN
jgi:hypothetical protein